MTSVFEKIAEWSDGDFNELHQLIDYYAKTRYSDYLPTDGPRKNFMARFEEAFRLLPDDQSRKTFMRLIPEIFYIQSREISSLYRAVFKNEIARWLVDLGRIDISARDAGKQIAAAVRTSWFCPITDSMQIANFYHVNGIEGVDYRTDWRSIQKFGTPDRIDAYMSQSKLERIVLLEDFVGTGSQIREAVTFAANGLKKRYPVLLAPLVICPKGDAICRELVKQNQNLTYTPLILIPQSFMLAKKEVLDEHNLFPSLRLLIESSADIVRGSSGAQWYGPFGFKSSGALCVMYSNCPNNTLPIIHRSSELWTAVFPRSSRVD
ncbi:MAG TPA: hypothetical protein PKE12_05440 [Kiritimatiellia bacterium]|nr:hypothetical protein [Kiritimatiellia bacterium]